MQKAHYPYKLQIFLDEDLRKQVKLLATERDLSLQDMVVILLERAVVERPDYLHAPQPVAP